MAPIRILVAQSRSDILAEVIAEAVRHAPDFDLVGGAIVATVEVEPLLLDDDVEIDVAVFIGDLPEASLTALIKRHHHSAVISHIEIGADAVHLDLEGIGLEQLLATWRVLARNHLGDRTIQYKVVGCRPSQSGRAELVPLSASRGSLIGRALAWVDAALLLYDRRHPTAPEDVPGFTRGPGVVIDALLGSDASNLEIAAAESALDDAAHSFTAKLAAADPCDTPLAALKYQIGLTPLEIKLVLLCLAPEVDPKYQAVFGIFNDDLSRRAPTFGLACALLGDPLEVRISLGASGGLSRWRLLEQGGGLPHADEPLRLEPTVITWLLGDGQRLINDNRLRHIVRPDAWPGAMAIGQTGDLALSESLKGLFSDGEPDTDWVVLAGDDATGWRAIVECAAAAAGAELLRVPLSGLAGVTIEDIDEFGVRIARAAQVTRAIAVLDASELATEPDGFDVACRLIAVLRGLTRPIVMIVPDPLRLADTLPAQVRLLRRDTPDRATLGAALASEAGAAGIAIGLREAEALAEAFPLSLGGIARAVRLAVLEGATADPSQDFGRLCIACRRVASPDLPRFSHRIEPAFRLTDVVLPADRLGQLHEMVWHVRHASQVLKGWGFGAQMPYGRGVAALFCGPSGTGKTMAAQAIAQELHRDIYAVDLSRVISKFIGESEKNLDTVFNDAERAGAVLLFDEADALFGKRSEVKDAHDRYANIEVAYLLQRIEAYSGLAILTTNFRQNLDQAFLRRLRFIVEFPRPDADAREAIWRRSLPQAAPCSDDVDIRFLARRLELTGGNIRQIALRAAFAAAGTDTTTIEMRHLVAATRAELFKLGMTGAERELAEFDSSRRRAPAAQAA